MSFFTDPSIDLSAKLLEVLYIFMGIILLYTSFRSFRDKTNQHAYGTSLFWGILGILIGFGRFIPPVACGVLIFVMTIPAILQKVTKGESRLPSKEYMEKMSQKLGMKIFIPALSIGVFAILFATLTTLGALVGVGVGVFVAIFIMMFFSKNNTPKVFFDDAAEMLETVGPLSTLPMLLACLGAVFTSAGVGEIMCRSTSRKCQCRDYYLCCGNGYFYGYHGQCLCSNNRDDSRNWCAVCLFFRCRSRISWDGCLNMWFLWYTVNTDGCEL